MGKLVVFVDPWESARGRLPFPVVDARVEVVVADLPAGHYRIPPGVGAARVLADDPRIGRRGWLTDLARTLEHAYPVPVLIVEAGRRGAGHGFVDAVDRAKRTTGVAVVHSAGPQQSAAFLIALAEHQPVALHGPGSPTPPSRVAVLDDEPTGAEGPALDVGGGVRGMASATESELRLMLGDDAGARMADIFEQLRTARRRHDH